MQTWTVVRFLHIVGFVFFVGGQLSAGRSRARAAQAR